MITNDYLALLGRLGGRQRTDKGAEGDANLLSIDLEILSYHWYTAFYNLCR